MDRSIMDMMKKKKKKKKKKKITLISSNDMTFEDIDLTMLYGCRVIKRRIEKAMCEVEEEEEGGDGDGDKIILRVPEITSKILSLVLEFCTKHGEEDSDRWQVKYATDEDLKRWQAKLATEVDEGTLAHLVLATDYLEMWELSEVVVDILNDKGKSPLEFAAFFQRRLENEEEELSRANLWA